MLEFIACLAAETLRLDAKVNRCPALVGQTFFPQTRPGSFLRSNQEINSSIQLCISLSVVSSSCLAAASAGAVSSAEKQPFGQTPDGKAMDLYTLRNDKGAEARIMNYGGIVVSLKVPDRNGNWVTSCWAMIVWRPTSSNSPYFGAFIGRYGNRIAKGQIHAGRRRLHTGHQQPSQCLARRPERV